MEFDDHGLIRRREASINDITEADGSVFMDGDRIVSTASRTEGLRCGGS
jgi:nuclear transport factor 2 (NTF2) superfamily protein